MIGATVRGIPELKAALAAIPDKLRRRALRNALAAGAREVQRTARTAAPVLQLAQQSPRRQSGTLRKAISVRTSKLARKRGDVGVFVNVKPAPKGQRGAKNPRDPFYWRWVEFGWNPPRSSDGRGAAGKKARRQLLRQGGAKRVPGVGFLQAGARRLGEALQIFIRQVGPAIAKLNNKGQTP